MKAFCSSILLHYIFLTWHARVKIRSSLNSSLTTCSINKILIPTFQSIYIGPNSRSVCQSNFCPDRSFLVKFSWNTLTLQLFLEFSRFNISKISIGILHQWIRNYGEWFMSKLFKQWKELRAKTPFIFTDPEEGMGHCNIILVS